MTSKKSIECSWLFVVLFYGIGFILLFSINSNTSYAKNGQIVNSTIDNINNLYNGNILIYYNNYCIINVIQSYNITFVEYFLNNNFPIDKNITIYIKNNVCYINNFFSLNYNLLYSSISFFVIGIILSTCLCLKNNNNDITSNTNNTKNQII